MRTIFVGGHSVHPCLRVSCFAFETIPPSKFENFDTSPYANPKNSTTLVSGNPVHKGGLGWCASAQTRRGALCASVSVGKVTLPMESHKESFVDPCAPRRLVLSVSRCYTTKTSSRVLPSLRMTHSREVCALHFAFSGCTECPPTRVRA